MRCIRGRGKSNPTAFKSPSYAYMWIYMYMYTFLIIYAKSNPRAFHALYTYYRYIKPSGLGIPTLRHQSAAECLCVCVCVCVCMFSRECVLFSYCRDRREVEPSGSRPIRAISGSSLFSTKTPAHIAPLASTDPSEAAMWNVLGAMFNRPDSVPALYNSRCAEVCVISKETLTWQNYHM